MSRTLLIRIDPTATEARWQVIENQRITGRYGHGSLSRLQRAAQGAHVVVLVPAEEVFLSYVVLPGKNRKKLVKALPYAIEDQLVDNIENLHFAMGNVEEGSRYLVAAVEKRLMDYWDSTLKAAGIHANEIVPDVAALYASRDDWTILLEEDRALVRGSNGMFASDISTLPVMLENLYQQSGDNKPQQISVYDCSGTDQMASLQEAADGMNFEVKNTSESAFSVFANQYSSKSSINLLQGDYSLKENISKHLKPWFPAAALFCVWLAWQLVLGIGAYVDLSARSDQLASEMQSVFKKAFRDAKLPPAGYERAYMEKQLNELLKRQGKSAGSLQELLSRSASIMKGIAGLEVQGIQFGAGNLTFELTIKQASDIEKLKETITGQTGFKVSSQATTEKGITKVRLKIAGGG